MCGISGYVGGRDAVAVVLDGLQHLEYRGYDSAGISVAGPDGLKVHKVQGRVAELAQSMPEMGSTGLAIGHTRWATHGVPSVTNAHPHMDEAQQFAVVHNGIIENAAALRARLESDGFVFASTTDTEVLVHLMASAATDDLEEAVHFALGFVEGTYGLAVVGAASPDRIVLARKGSPVVIGVGDGEHFVGSDVAAFGQYTQRVLYLEDHELAVVRRDGFSTRGLNSATAQRPVTTFSWTSASYETGEFAHFMVKEIHEEPAAIRRFLSSRLDASPTHLDLPELEMSAAEAISLRRVTLLGCGSAYYAGLAGAQLIERLAGIPADAEAASEFRYRRPIVDPDTLYVALSQSGETLDTLQALWEIQRQGGRVLSIVNVADSSIDRSSPSCIHLQAGPEISVTSTKTFDSTLVALTAVALTLGRLRGLDQDHSHRILTALQRLPTDLEEALDGASRIAEIAARYASAQSAFFIGRVAGYPIALEGSQKLKEVSYIHAEAYPCGELKHGPLALITPDLPTVAVVPSDALFAKNMATLEEIRARRGPIIAVGHSQDLKSIADEVVLVPKSEPELDPILLLLPLQLLAYHTAVTLGLDVDKPRNLAKSVTVE